MCEGNEVARCERRERSEVTRWERWESSEVAKWEVPGFIRGWGKQSESKISFFFFVSQRNEVAGCV